MAEDLLKRMEELKKEILPADVQVVVTRNYGVTANDKVKELEEGMFVAIAVVMALLAIGLGYRQALVVAIVVPCVFGLTLIVNYFLGFSINRISLFALTVALGLLVDDPIVDVENIHRHFQMRGKATAEVVLEAVNEVRPPLIAATFAVILSFLPLLFVTDMMGQYLRPMAANIPVTMIMSLVVSFTITPWLAYKLLKGHAAGEAPGRTAGVRCPARGVSSTDAAAADPASTAGPGVSASGDGAVRRQRAADADPACPVEAVALRQQRRDAAGPRHADGHDAGADRCGRPRFRALPGVGSRNHRFRGVRGDGLAGRLQRVDAPVFPAPGAQPRGHPGQPDSQDGARLLQPYARLAASRRPDSHRATGRSQTQDRRAAGRASGDVYGRCGRLRQCHELI